MENHVIRKCQKWLSVDSSIIDIASEMEKNWEHQEKLD